MSVFLKREKPLPTNAPRPIVAAAARMRTGERSEIETFKKRRGGSDWQAEAWDYYDAIGEIKYAFMLVGAVMSRLKLYVAVTTEPSDPPSPIEDIGDFDGHVEEMAQRHLRRLDTGHGGISGMLRDAAINLSVVGECYLVQTPAMLGSQTPERWDIRSVDEIVVENDGLFIQTARSMGRAGLRPIPRDAFVGRVWRPHPRYHDESDSSMRALLAICEELLLLNRAVRATAKSRLNAGALFLPDGLSVSASPDVYEQDGDGSMTVDEEHDAFEEELLTAMTTPIRDEDSASAVVPLIIRGPGELGSQIKQFKFERSFDSALADRADRVLERILQGIDVPKDIVTGLASVRYSNAVHIEESLFKAHIEPLALLVCDALTMMYMRPALLAGGVDPDLVDRIHVWYDPTDIMTRPNRASDANEGWDRYLLKGSTWRAAHGFSEEDAPDGEELVARLAIQRGQMTGELSEGIFQQVAPELMGNVRGDNMAQSDVPMPDALQQMLSGQVPAGGGVEGVDPSILEGLPVADEGGGEPVPAESSPQQPGTEMPQAPSPTDW